MKPFLALIAGFVTASILFASGAVITMNMILAKPDKALEAGNTALWSSPVPSNDERPRLVASASADEIPARAPQTASADNSPDLQQKLPVDTMQTASLSGETRRPRPVVRSDEHFAWCSRKYRSYQPETDSYTSYGGAIRPCISPYSDDLTATADTEPTIIDASGDSSLIDAHVQACMERYRSYRIEDNSYQPYGGGPRRQCN